MNYKSNWPNAQEVTTEPGEMGKLVARMSALGKLPPVREPEEVQERIEQYFQWCVANDCRPAVESMALAIGVTRKTLLEWQKRGDRRGSIITRAKQVLAALMENWGISGKINPAALCFMMKNQFEYQDNVTITAETNNEMHAKRTTQEIEEQYAQYAEFAALPEKPNFDD